LHKVYRRRIFVASKQTGKMHTTMKATFTITAMKKIMFFAGILSCFILAINI